MSELGVVARSKLKGYVLNSQSWEMISNEYTFMKEEANNQTVTIPLTKSRLRTAAATGATERTVTKIQNWT